MEVECTYEMLGRNFLHGVRNSKHPLIIITTIQPANQQ